MSTTTSLTSLQSRFQSFSDEFGDEIATCNPNAWDSLQDIVSREELSLRTIEDFIWDYADELDACHPEAFDMLYDMAKTHDIEI